MILATNSADFRVVLGAREVRQNLNKVSLANVVRSFKYRGVENSWRSIFGKEKNIPTELSLPKYRFVKTARLAISQLGRMLMVP